MTVISYHIWVYWYKTNPLRTHGDTLQCRRRAYRDIHGGGHDATEDKQRARCGCVRLCQHAQNSEDEHGPDSGRSGFLIFFRNFFSKLIWELGLKKH